MSFRSLLILIGCAGCLQIVLASELEDGFAALHAEDFDSAMELLLPIAEAGDPAAQNAIGGMYAHGWGVEQDYGEAAGWFRKSAEQGFVGGQLSLGRLYSSGQGVEQNYDEAQRWTRKAAEQGSADAQAELASMLALGEGRQDINEAAKWTRMAAEQGHEIGQYNLAASYALGLGVRQDYSEALAWYRKSAEQGFADAQFKVGMMHELGQGVEADEYEAGKWYAMAAEQGHPEARERLLVLESTGVLQQGLSSQTLSEERDADRTEVEEDSWTEPSSEVVEMLQLARSYLSNSYVLNFLLRPEGKFPEGLVIHLDGKKITKKNVGKHRRKYQKKLDKYRQQIERRGYESIAGEYTSDTTESCERIQSIFAFMRVPEFRGLEIVQDGIEATVKLKFAWERKRPGGNPAAICGQGIAILDELNSAYYFWGVIEGDRIVIRPDLSVLETWPEFAGPPDPQDLEQCRIVLKPVRIAGSE